MEKFEVWKKISRGQSELRDESQVLALLSIQLSIHLTPKERPTLQVDNNYIAAMLLFCRGFEMSNTQLLDMGKDVFTQYGFKVGVRILRQRGFTLTLAYYCFLKLKGIWNDRNYLDRPFHRSVLLHSALDGVFRFQAEETVHTSWAYENAQAHPVSQFLVLQVGVYPTPAHESLSIRGPQRSFHSQSDSLFVLSYTAQISLGIDPSNSNDHAVPLTDLPTNHETL